MDATPSFEVTSMISEVASNPELTLKISQLHKIYRILPPCVNSKYYVTRGNILQISCNSDFLAPFLKMDFSFYLKTVLNWSL